MTTTLNKRLNNLWEQAREYIQNQETPSECQVDLIDEDDMCRVDVAVPGMKKEDLSVELLPGNYLRVSGQHNQSEEFNFAKKEINFFIERTVKLPEGLVDEPKCELHDGILTLTWEKVQPRQISIDNSESQESEPRQLNITNSN